MTGNDRLRKYERHPFRPIGHDQFGPDARENLCWCNHWRDDLTTHFDPESKQAEQQLAQAVSDVT